MSGQSFKGNVDSQIMDNPATKVPLSLILDVSQSMLPQDGEAPQDSRIGRVKEALYNIVSELREFGDGVTAPVLRVIFCGLTDNDKSHHNIHATDFYDPENFDVNKEWENLPEGLTMGGGTPLGEATIEAIEGYNNGLRAECRAGGIKVYAPWFITISDGDANGLQKRREEAISLVKRSSESANFQFLVIAIDDESLKDKLSLFSPRAEVVTTTTIDIEKILKTVTDTFQSIPADFSPDEKISHDKNLALELNSDDDGADDISEMLL